MRTFSGPFLKRFPLQELLVNLDTFRRLNDPVEPDQDV
jgi:hypothetical protein